MLAAAFVCTMIGTPVSRLAAAIAATIVGTSPTSPYSSTAHFRKAARDARVVDPLPNVAHEQLGKLIDRPVPEELRQLHERVEPGRHDDVEVDLGVDPLDPRDATAEPDDGRVDQRPEPGLADGAELRDRVRDSDVLVPQALTQALP